MEKVADKVDRRGIGPVEIVESHHQRPLVGKLADQRTHGTQEAVALVGCGDRLLHPILRSERWKYRGEQSDLLVREREALTAKRSDGTLERVGEHRERHARLELGRAPRQGQVAMLVGARQSLGDQRRLADARLADDADGAVLALAEGVEPQADLRELGAAANEPRTASGTRELQSSPSWYGP
jgi:hypothetical protein